jgi:glycine/D-amino acid oxidase-like deaminating enzyme
VDPGLLPWGECWLAGQISLVRPGLGAGSSPDGALQEQRLRQALAPLLPGLGHWPGTFLQVPVSFCSDGEPLVGPVAAAPGLWVFAGFSAAFTAIPPRAAGLARLLAGSVAQHP